MNTGTKITFLNPGGLAGKEITELLKEANIAVTTIYKESERDPEISIEGEIFSYKGISEIRNFIKSKSYN